MMLKFIGLLFLIFCLNKSETAVIRRHHHLINKIVDLFNQTEYVKLEYQRIRFSRRDFDTNDVNITYLPQLSFDVADNAQEGDLLFTHVADLNIFYDVLQYVKTNEADVNKNSLHIFDTQFQDICNSITAVTTKMTDIIQNKGLNGTLLRNPTTVQYTFMLSKAELHNFTMELLIELDKYVVQAYTHVTALYYVLTA
ncbi:uncharacterized protein LOC117111476 [Anneissia japonica]|uniref:uncharacterized protein LOC117111476 n=1 Tax=Anneissia japonica TaxID=1529436 RepID=UPI0014256B04|nr:uncharacterized protein LOC117111476 [Anneissia japonica]